MCLAYSRDKVFLNDEKKSAAEYKARYCEIFLSKSHDDLGRI